MCLAEIKTFKTFPMKLFKKQPKSLVRVSQHEFQARRVSITEHVTTRAARHGYLPHENLRRRERPIMKPEPTAGPELSRTPSACTWLRARSPGPWRCHGTSSQTFQGGEQLGRRHRWGRAGTDLEDVSLLFAVRHPS